MLKQHVDRHVRDAPDAFVFTGESGRTIWRGNFNQLVKWSDAVTAIGAPGLHFHDLRHTGNTPGVAGARREPARHHGADGSRQPACGADLPARREADQWIADAIDKAVKAAQRKPSKRKPKRAAEGDGPAAEAS